MSAIINPATGKPFKQVAPSRNITYLRQQIIKSIKMRYDAAQTTSQNELHWQKADNLSPNAANSLAVRKKLRSRSRYEVQNNGYLLGILLSLSNDMVGSGPTLQITDSRFTDEQKRAIERRWKQRREKVKLRRKLWRMRFAKCQDGEAFSFAYTDRRRSYRHPVKVNQRVFECDQVSHYEFSTDARVRQTEIDGIRFDPSSGEPIQYHLLNDHPGETFLFGPSTTKGEWFDDEQVIHWFRQQRGWLRGIPETTATLPLWALLRRYTLAVVQNAEIAADFTVLLKSMQPASTNPFSLSEGEPTEENPEDWFDSFPIDRGLMTVLPTTYDLEQLDPKQPVNMYDSFVTALIQEAARPLMTPINVSTANSSDHNMSAGTLDRQMYRGAINVERIDCGEEVLDKDLSQWWFEAIRVPGYFDDEGLVNADVKTVVSKFASLREDPPEHTYRWDEVAEHSDPVKVAQATDILHRAGHISDTDIQEGRFNRSTEEHYANLERQQTWREEHGLSLIPSNETSEDLTIDDDDDDLP